jgi:shikimate dehydrogenase
VSKNLTPLDRYAVMGNPIGHSKSPQIHAQFAAQTGQRLSYEAMLVELGEFPTAVTAFHSAGGKGLNITVPFKQEAWLLAQIRTPRAERAGAVNTLWWNEQGKLFGDTTDGVGLVHDLRNNQGLNLAGLRILLLGAGGAARGVVEPLLAEQPQELVIANRTAAKATELASLFRPLGPVSSCDFETLHTRQFDLVINATAAGLSGAVPPISESVFAKNAWAYDMMYAVEPTAFMSWALQAGAAQARDGLGMLVEQAAEAFWIWRGVRPETGPVIEQLRKP